MALFKPRDRVDPKALEGTTLPDNTRVVKLVGAGAFSHVYRARTEQGNVVALKVLSDPDPIARKRFFRESKVLQLLGDNPYVVRFLGRGELHDGRPYMRLEFVRGYTLRSLLDSGYVLEPRPAAVLANQLCESFTELHRLGVAHGDVCPSNVMITSDGKSAKLFDFGLARDAQGLLKLFEKEDMVEGDDFGEDIDRGVLMGTPAYMAPEQIEDALEPGPVTQTDTQSDVYALGVMLYEMVGGKNPHPFESTGNSRRETEAAIDYCHARLEAAGAPFEPLEVPAGLWAIISEATHANPKMRMGDARAMRTELERFLAAPDDAAPFVPISTTIRKIETMVEEEPDADRQVEATMMAPEADRAEAPPWRQALLVAGSIVAGSLLALAILRLL